MSVCTSGGEGGKYARQEDPIISRTVASGRSCPPLRIRPVQWSNMATTDGSSVSARGQPTLVANNVFNGSDQPQNAGAGESGAAGRCAHVLGGCSVSGRPCSESPLSVKQRFLRLALPRRSGETRSDRRDVPHARTGTGTTGRRSKPNRERLYNFITMHRLVVRIYTTSFNDREVGRAANESTSKQ
ncbi:hypothetical protein Bbelb_337850 [Branchiostoma belcheri]|nr:hypothetical protein Bbelb_337850 [Branchiostoma belcheri]